MIAVIEFRNVTRRFGDIEAVRDLSFTVETGDVVGLLGANGAGKTTTMQLMTGYYPPSEGEVRLGGQLVQRNPLGIKRRIGYLPERPPLYDEMSVRDYLEYMAVLKEVPDGRLGDRIAWTLDRLELNDQSERLIGNLSRGYRQRVALGQALVHDPDLLVLDEPTLGLDPKQVRRLRELIGDLAEESTLIISSHILPEVRQICRRVIILNRGEMVAVDTPERLAAEMRAGQAWELEVHDPPGDWLERLRALERVETVDAIDDNRFGVVFTTGDNRARRELFDLCRKEEVPILQLSRTELDLEEIFLELTTETRTGGDGTPEPEAADGSS